MNNPKEKAIDFMFSNISENSLFKTTYLDMTIDAIDIAIKETKKIEFQKTLKVINKAIITERERILKIIDNTPITLANKKFMFDTTQVMEYIKELKEKFAQKQSNMKK